MDVITALNGSGPAFAYLVLEALADGAVMMGLRRDVAFTWPPRCCRASARMVLESGLHPAALKDQVTTPAGCTIAGLLTLEDGRIRSVLARAVEEATQRGRPAGAELIDARPHRDTAPPHHQEPMAAPPAPQVRVPITRPQLGKSRGRRRRPRGPLALGASRAPRSPPSRTSWRPRSAPRTRWPSPAAPPPWSWRCACWAWARATRSSPSATASSPPPTCIMAVGARPVFVDVERDNFGMDPALIEAALSPADQGDPVRAPARAFPASWAPSWPSGASTACRWSRTPPARWAARCASTAAGSASAGPHGVMACFSFHPRKIITTGDGGMITTSDGALAARLRSLRQHAMSRLPPEARDRDPLARESYVEPAYNYRMTDIAGGHRPAAAGPPGRVHGRAPPPGRRLRRARWRTTRCWRRRSSGPTPAPTGRATRPCPPGRGAGPRTRCCASSSSAASPAAAGITNAHQEPAYAGRDNWRGGPLPVVRGAARTDRDAPAVPRDDQGRGAPGARAPSTTCATSTARPICKGAECVIGRRDLRDVSRPPCSGSRRSGARQRLRLSRTSRFPRRRLCLVARTTGGHMGELAVRRSRPSG